MSSSNCRKYLEKSLASLLGYDIGDVEDVIEHLLTFESKEDLLEHLSALLGRDDDENVISFVNDVDKFQNGERLIVPVDNSSSSSSCQREIESSTKKKKAEEEEKQQRQKEREEKEIQEQKLVERMKIEQQKELDRIQKEKEERERIENRKAKQKAAKGKNTKLAKAKAQKVKNTTTVAPDSIVMNGGGSSHVQKKEKEQEKRKKSQPMMPLTGKAKIICGCFGTIHKPLANCLNCGRIICTKEGYGYCPSCSYLVVEHVRLEGEAFDRAIMHKERLLEFDRQSASRTQVYDSQADYYSNSRSNWLSENEQLDAERKEEERRKEVHSRKHVLGLDL